ncbi:MAG: gamma-glutamyl-gamma-aminobutyrate hydrolase family protein [Chloroflexi bacterium]|nr:gamma-glutamyl-gamma-aminobutyrate hydrolase family protein [Chloroflexota bacterium]
MTSDNAGPLIAVAYVRPASEDDARYLAAIVAAGGTPLPLLADAPDWQAELARADGLLLTGGGDIGAAYYGLDACAACRAVDPRRDRLELLALETANRRRLPTLGICRGMQFLNVAWPSASPGRLLPDLPRQPIRHTLLADRSSSYHMVTVDAGTRLAAILGRTGVLQVNSRHHQGLSRNQLAGGLRAAAVADDGVVEALEAPGDRFVVGVQCHPERSGEAPEMARVFVALVETARATQPTMH